MKRVFIVHGWDGHPDEGWFPWLKAELESRGYEVLVPQLPDPENPRIQNWVPALAAAVGPVDTDTFFVGHSMGCQTIARFLVTLPSHQQIGGVVYVAGFYKHLSNLEDDASVRQTEKHWLQSPLNLADVKTHGPSIAIFSDNDPWVPLDNQDAFRDTLGSQILVQHAMGHFSGSQGIVQLPVALEALLQLQKLTNA